LLGFLRKCSYDLKGTKVFKNSAGTVADYCSTDNSISFQSGDLRFTGTGKILVTVSTFPESEHFGVVAHRVDLPKGWATAWGGFSHSYGLVLQNAPPKKVITKIELPDRISLTDFATRSVRLDFRNGVRFPGGEVDKRAVVEATVESLEEVGHR
jgi:hypothetical protein